jgi:hypothetical protein
VFTARYALSPFNKTDYVSVFKGLIDSLAFVSFRNEEGTKKAVEAYVNLVCGRSSKFSEPMLRM